MAKEPGQKTQRYPIDYFEGVNATVSHNIAKPTELYHMENARSPVIGVLEKRQGQEEFGLGSDGESLISAGNFGLYYFPNDGDNSGLYRISKVAGVVSVFVLGNDDIWYQLSDADANSLSEFNFSFSNVDSNLVFVNQNDTNRMILEDGNTVITSTDVGSLFNSPKAMLTSFYKNRIYLGDFIRNGVEYKTTVIRSSFPMGIVALANGDVTAATGPVWTIPVTDAKYFYADAGMNQYDIYRGATKIAVITVSEVHETSIDVLVADMVFEAGQSSILSADEIWVLGTYTGKKQYRWVNNPTKTGGDVKLYDTFKLSGGDEDALTIMEPVGNVLILGNKHTMMSWNDYNLENFDLGVGCVSRHGYTKLLGTLYFIHYSGIFSMTGSAPQLISRKVERYIKGASRAGLEGAAVGFKGLSIFFSIGDVNLYNDDGSFWKTLPDTCLEFHVADQDWYIHTNVSADDFESFVDSGGVQRLVMSDSVVASAGVFGPEMIINGDFTGNDDNWALDNGWTYGSNKVTKS